MALFDYFGHNFQEHSNYTGVFFFFFQKVQVQMLSGFFNLNY